MKRQEEHRPREPQEKTQKEREHRFPQPKIKVGLVWILTTLVNNPFGGGMC